MSKRIEFLFPIFALCILALSIYLAMALITPPAPQPLSIPATEFSAMRAMQDLAVIARESRPIGSSHGHAAARDYLLQTISALGLEPEVQQTIGIRIIEPGWIIAGAVENILVRLPGAESGSAILLLAHYDSAPESYGALDNGTGVVTILEVLRSLNAGLPLRRDVIILFVDGEEPGLLGAEAFISQHPWFDQVEFIINVDTFEIGPPMLLRSSSGNGLLIRALAQQSLKPAFISLPFHLFLSDESDAVAFFYAGLPGADIQTTASRPEKHTSLDRLEIVDPSSVQQAGSQLLGLVRYLADLPEMESNIPDETYFPMFGRLIYYPSDWALGLAFMAGSLFLGTISYGFYTKDITWRGLGFGFVTIFSCLIISVVLINFLWLGIQAFHPEYAYSAHRLHLSDDFLYGIGLFALVIAIPTFLMIMVRKKISSLDFTAGSILFWFPLAIASAVIVPDTSYLATWTLLLGSLTLLLALVNQSRKHGWLFTGLCFLVGAVLMTFLWIPVMYISFLGSSFPMLSLLVVVASFWVVAVLPTLDWISSSRRWFLPVAVLLVGLGFLIAGHFYVAKNSPPPLVNGIGYWFDADREEAYWIARSDDLDERQAHLLADPVVRSYTEIFPEAPHFSVFTNTAPRISLEGPNMEIIEDRWVIDRRVVRIKLTSSMHDRVYIIIPNESPLAMTFSNIKRTELPPGDREEWALRFDGIPTEGIEINFEFSNVNPIRFLIVEERTGLPSFPGLVTQPLPGTVRTPGEFSSVYYFTAIYRSFLVNEFGK